MAWVESNCPSDCGIVWGDAECEDNSQRPPKPSHNHLGSYSRPRLSLFSKVGYRDFISVDQVIITTGYSGTTDKVSIILVGQGGAQTSVYDLPGTFPRNRQVIRILFLKLDCKSLFVKSFTRTDVFLFSVKFFQVRDRGVGAVSAVKIRLKQKGLYRDFWYLEQVISWVVIRFLFSYTTVKEQS